MPRRITDRDRELLQLLLLLGLASDDQLRERLLPGRHPTGLFHLARRLKAPPALIEAVPARYPGRTDRAWRLTPAGLGLALADASAELVARLPEGDQRHRTQDHVAHLLETNALWLDLTVARTEVRRRSLERRYLWTPSSEKTLLSYEDYAGTTVRRRRIAPDAVLELPDSGQRVFVECERGGHPIERAGGGFRSLAGKLARYRTYLSGRPIEPGAGTWYQSRYPDAWSPTVLFMVHSERRAKNVRGRLADELAACGFEVLIETREGATRTLRFLGRSPPPVEPVAPTLEGLLQDGTLERFVVEAFALLRQARHEARSEGRAQVPYPTDYERVVAAMTHVGSESGLRATSPPPHARPSRPPLPMG